jgi:mono/diheme cytochrome c family protein
LNVPSIPAGNRPRRRLRYATGLLAVLALILLASTWRPVMAPRAEGPPPSFDPALVQRGASLAVLGLCANCHTARPNAPFAGGFAIATPFGTVHSTNITPDRATGIGTWTEPAFARAMQHGVARNGSHLYPAFPYDHYTRLQPGDIGALYAFFMTRDPIRAPAVPNELVFPLGFRPFLAGWKLLFLNHDKVPAQSSQSAEWNRGAYIAAALGHCAACHSPRNVLGAVDQKQFLGGGEAEGWYAPAMNHKSPSPIAWNRDSLTQYLRSGIAPAHAMAGGPMQAVTASLGQANPADVRALATYIVSLMGKPAPAIEARASAALAGPAVLPAAPPGNAPVARQLQLGSRVYEDACARCHASGRTVGSGGALQLPAAIAVYDPDPRSLIRIVRDGIAPGPAVPGRWMPGFAGILTNEQVTALAAYLRQSAAQQAPWPDLARQVADAAKEQPAK